MESADVIGVLGMDLNLDTLSNVINDNFPLCSSYENR